MTIYIFGKSCLVYWKIEFWSDCLPFAPTTVDDYFCLIFTAAQQGLKITNSDLTHRVTELEKEVVDKNDRITVLQVQLESTSSCPPSASSPSLQPDPDQMAVVGHAQTAELLSQLGENVQDVVAALSDLHTYWQHRYLHSNEWCNQSWSVVLKSSLLLTFLALLLLLRGFPNYCYW